jgi:hypothetical protein
VDALIDETMAVLDRAKHESRDGRNTEGSARHKDGASFKPDDINLDEREPTIIPWAFPGQQTQDHCPAAGEFNGALSRVDGFIEDYFKYLPVVKNGLLAHLRFL